MSILLKDLKRKMMLMLGIIIVFVIGLTMVALIPTSMVESNVYNSLKSIDDNEDRTWYFAFTYETGSRLDDYTDSIMISYASANSDENNALENAMNVGGYTRYWHGYLFFLKPLLVFFNYLHIRYILMYLYLGLFVWASVEIYKRIGMKGSMAFAFSFATIYFNVLSFSLQFSSVFLVTLLATICVCRKFDRHLKISQIANWFLIIGMLVNYFDLLTAPLVTLGIPLLLVILMNLSVDTKMPISKNYKILLVSSIAWGMGYGVTWISKWIIASIVLKKNVIVDAISQALFRINGDEDVPLNRLQMFRDNINGLIPSWLWTSNRSIILVIIGIGIMLVIFIFKRKSFHEIKKMFPLVIIAIYPYVWYFVMSNHSQIHFFFTYRTQMITVFSLLTFFLYSLRDSKTKINDNILAKE